MNYRHLYHAGNFADVFKHIVLIALVKSFLQKESAFCYLDTHAGLGQYDFFSEAASKTREYKLGITKIYQAKHPPSLIKEYLQWVKKINADKTLRFYPGSPYFVKEYLRSQDRMILSELHPEDVATLKTYFCHQAQVAIHHQDGYVSLKAFLPPKERRGLILIDPPYEKVDEYTRLLTVLPEAVHRFATGCFMLWYPIKNRRVTDRWQAQLKQKINRPMLAMEFSIYPDDTDNLLNGCGILIINPPWKLQAALQENLTWLWQQLNQHKQGHFSFL